MAIVTLTLDQFFGQLQVAEEEFYLQENMSYETDRAGRIYTSDVGPRLWTGKVTISGLVNWDAPKQRALIARVTQPGVRFLIHSRASVRPQADPNGALYGAATPILKSVLEKGIKVIIWGLPSNYVITAGDAFSWTQAGAAPYRYHEAAEDAVASATGAVQIPVNPPLVSGAVLNSSLRFIKPRLRAVYIPRSRKPSLASGVFSSGASFSWVQTLE